MKKQAAHSTCSSSCSPDSSVDVRAIAHMSMHTSTSTYDYVYEYKHIRVQRHTIIDEYEYALSSFSLNLGIVRMEKSCMYTRNDLKKIGSFFREKNIPGMTLFKH